VGQDLFYDDILLYQIIYRLSRFSIKLQNENTINKMYRLLLDFMQIGLLEF